MNAPVRLRQPAPYHRFTFDGAVRVSTAGGSPLRDLTMKAALDAHHGVADLPMAD